MWIWIYNQAKMEKRVEYPHKEANQTWKIVSCSSESYVDLNIEPTVNVTSKEIYKPQPL